MSGQKEDSYYLRSGLRIYPAQHEAINRLLAELLDKTPAHFILLTDVTGQVVSTAGDQSGINLVSLASLVAGDLAASQEIARLTGQLDAYQMILREGQNAHTFISEAGDHLALLVQISTEVPLGWARMTIRQAARQLAEIVAAPPAREADSPPSELDLAPDSLPDLFDEALGDLWME
ncbi:MAG: hypothetical protein D6796_14890 [Caldilineae bacterium]|nr:MAG: hypothetical protein D6796_14890 [Caldilineae bacterium]